MRKEFEGIIMINPITGRQEPLFTKAQRLRRYFESLIICLPFFIIVLFVMVCFLNLNAIVNPQTHGGLFYIEPLANLCLPGNVFDP